MKKKCDCCGQSYEPETGFYYGAMYVSYALGVAVMVVPAMLLYLLFDLGFGALLAFVITVYIFGFPLFFRFARNIWFNIFVHYDPELRRKLENKTALPS